MRIVFLVGALDRLGPLERAVMTQANALASSHDVQVVSILRTSQRRIALSPAVPVNWLTSATPEDVLHEISLKIGDESTLQGRGSVLVPGHWDPALSALSDVALERYLPRVQADIVVTPTPGLLAAAAQLLPSGVVLVHQEHRSSMHRHAGQEGLLAFAPRADVVVVPAQREADWLRTQLGDRAPTTRVIPPMLPAGPRPRSLLDQPLIVAGGPLVPEKQHHHMIRAFAHIADQLPEWRLRILGAGPQRELLFQTIRRAGLYDRVELPGPTPDIASSWATAGISLLTSRREGIALPVLEAMAAGVPVIAYDCPTGPADLIRNGQNGVLVAQDDRVGLASALLELARDPALRALLGAAALDTSLPFHAPVVAQQWEEMLQHALGSRRERSSGRAVPSASPSQAGTTPVSPHVRATDIAEVRPVVARRTALEVASVAAGASAPDWFVLPAHGSEPPVVVVPQPERDAFLETLAGVDAPAYLSLSVSEGDYWQARRGPIHDMARFLRTTMAPVLSLEPWAQVDGAAHHLSHAAGVRVEFWSRTPGGKLAAPGPNPYALRVPPEIAREAVVLEGVPVPGLPGLTGPFSNECRFPIDVVYTWVDDQDPGWRSSLQAARSAASGTSAEQENSGDARFRSRDELRYSLRSIHMFAPWVRRIHIVTAGQTPAWLRDSDQVRVVDHREILPADALPTFNSHAIETALHRVPGLTEHFLYFNDDVFLGRPTRPEQFFTPSGQAAVFPAPWPIGVEGHDRRTFILAAHNNRRLLEQRFGVTITSTLAHTPHPHRRSVLERLTEEFPEQIAATARSRFRAEHDLSVASSLAQHYGLITGSAVEADLAERFVDLSTIAVERKLTRLRAREWDTFCLGDQHEYAIPVDEVGDLVRTFLESYFPVRPPWET
ncbi:MAG: stealth conserved region 3 domain-containing protein [Nocardioides sp.]